MLVAAGNGVALGALWRIYPTLVGWDAPVIWLTALVALGSVAVLLWMPRWGYRPL
ncbi:MAG: hypothetical protein AB3X44_07475 [Leptothrix sp. (in: b-proteobacteria)]